MQTSYNAGDAIRVYETPGNRARAEHGEPSVPGRPATVTRAMPYDAGQYEVAFTDGGAGPASAIVTPETMLPVAAIPAALAASAAQTMARAAEVHAEAQRLAAEAQRLADAAQAAAASGE